MYSKPNIYYSIYLHVIVNNIHKSLIFNDFYKNFNKYSNEVNFGNAQWQMYHETNEA